MKRIFISIESNSDSIDLKWNEIISIGAVTEEGDMFYAENASLTSDLYERRSLSDIKYITPLLFEEEDTEKFDYCSRINFSKYGISENSVVMVSIFTSKFTMCELFIQWLCRLFQKNDDFFYCSFVTPNKGGVLRFLKIIKRIPQDMYIKIIKEGNCIFYPHAVGAFNQYILDIVLDAETVVALSGNPFKTEDLHNHLRNLPDIGDFMATLQCASMWGALCNNEEEKADINNFSMVINFIDKERKERLKRNSIRLHSLQELSPSENTLILLNDGTPITGATYDKEKDVILLRTKE